MNEQVRPLTPNEMQYYRSRGTFDGINLIANEPVVIGEDAPGRGGQLAFRTRLLPDVAVPLVAEE